MFKTEILKETQKVLENKNAENIISFFQSLENDFASRANRPPATIEMKKAEEQKGNKNSYYDMDTHQIMLTTTETTEAIGAVLSTRHESVHADQNTSPLNSPAKQKLYVISQALYVSPDAVEPSQDGKQAVPVEYICNYKELEAKVIEAKYLIELYEKEKMLAPNGVLPISEGKQLKRAVEDMINQTKLITSKNIRKLTRTNIQRIKKGDYNEERAEGMNERQMLFHLRFHAPLLFLQMAREINKINKELLKIINSLNKEYSSEIGETSLIIATQKAEEFAKREDAFNELMKGYRAMDGSKVVEFVLDHPSKAETFEGIESFKERIEDLCKDSRVDQIAADCIASHDVYRIVYTEKTGKVSEATKVLEENEIHAKNEAVNRTSRTSADIKEKTVEAKGDER